MEGGGLRRVARKMHGQGFGKSVGKSLLKSVAKPLVKGIVVEGAKELGSQVGLDAQTSKVVGNALGNAAGNAARQQVEGQQLDPAERDGDGEQRVRQRVGALLPRVEQGDLLPLDPGASDVGGAAGGGRDGGCHDAWNPQAACGTGCDRSQRLGSVALA